MAAEETEGGEMICPDDGTRLNCTNTRTRGGYVSRNYKCSTCGKNFSTAEFFRERQKANKKAQLVRGEAFGESQIEAIKDKLIADLNGLIAQVKDS
jgi:hypothetical protein